MFINKFIINLGVFNYLCCGLVSKSTKNANTRKIHPSNKSETIIPDQLKEALLLGNTRVRNNSKMVKPQSKESNSKNLLNISK